MSARFRIARSGRAAGPRRFDLRPPARRCRQSWRDRLRARRLTHLPSRIFTGTTSETPIFRRCHLLVRESERDVMFAEPPSPRTEPANFSALKKVGRSPSRPTTTMSRRRNGCGEGDAGHSPGHQVLFMKLARTGPILLSGDLYPTQKNGRSIACRRRNSMCSRRSLESRR